MIELKELSSIFQPFKVMTVTLGLADFGLFVCCQVLENAAYVRASITTIKRLQNKLQLHIQAYKIARFLTFILRAPTQSFAKCLVYMRV